MTDGRSLHVQNALDKIVSTTQLRGNIEKELKKVAMETVSTSMNLIVHTRSDFNTKKYHVFAPMGRFQLESIYLYFPPSSQLSY